MSKTLVQTIELAVSPEELYAIYLDSKRHGEATGGAAKISRAVGGRFSAWDGYIVGRNLRLVPGKLIVQSWRSPDWKASVPDSVLVLAFEKSARGTRLTMTHANVPDGEAKSLRAGWHQFYWRPIRVYLERVASSSTPRTPRTRGKARSRRR